MFPVIDWQTTFYHNLLADGITTHQFTKRGYVERWNLIAKPFVDGGRWVEFAALGAMEIWAVESLPKKDRGNAYKWLGVLHGLAAMNTAGSAGRWFRCLWLGSSRLSSLVRCRTSSQYRPPSCLGRH